MYDPSTAYSVLCYHYLRPDKGDPFPRLLGHSEKQLIEHVKLLKKHFYILSPAEVSAFHGKRQAWPSAKPGLLITFDDGLSDHVRAAEILEDHAISAIFFVPTCPLLDQQPANPIILHYSLAIFGIEKFLAFYHEGLAQFCHEASQGQIAFQRKNSDAWAVISEIKQTLKYKIAPDIARQVLLHVYNKLLKAQFPDILHQMHIDQRGLEAIQALGHTIGAHSRTHISVADGCTTPEDFTTELIEPGQYLSEMTGNPTNFFSFPFGEPRDCLSPDMISSLSTSYELAFTVDPVANRQDTPVLALGRYAPMSSESDVDILGRLTMMIDKATGTSI